MSNDIKEPLNNLQVLDTACASNKVPCLPKTSRTLTGPKLRGDVPTTEKNAKKEVKRVLPVSTKGRLIASKNVNGRVPATKGAVDGNEKLKNGPAENPPKNIRIGNATATRTKVDVQMVNAHRTRFQNATAVNPGGIQKRAEPSKPKSGSSVNGADAPSRHEVLAHLKRLTEEHAKLQTEYARVRTLLQDANIKSSSRIGSPVPADKTETNGACSVDVSTGNGAAGGQLQRSESEKGVAEENDEIEVSVSAKDGFRREVLRLKEELLATQQQLTCITEAKSVIEQEQAHLVVKQEETVQEIMARESLIEQLSRQVVQLKSRMNMQKAEHMQQMEEIEEAQVALSRRLKEVENESRETKEFMQDENNSLAEALREAEDKAECYQLELNRHQYTLETKEKHCQVLSQVVEQTQAQLRLLQSELTDTQDGAKQLLMKQGAELGECGAAVGHVRQLTEEITKRIIANAEELGVDVNSTGAAKKRRSSDGRKLVWAILQAAGTGGSERGGGDKNDGHRTDNGTNGNSTDGESEYSLAAQMKEVEEGIKALGRIQHVFNQFLFDMLNEVETEKIKLEKDLGGERKRLDEMQTELEENVKRRWTLEEKNKELVKELMETKDGLKEAHDSIREMWDKIDEKANWLIENKKLKEEVDLLMKQCKLAEGKVDLLTNELQETVAKCESAQPSLGEYVNKQMILKDEILKLQHLLMDREEDLQERTQKHERHQKVVNGNLQKAEQEVKKLDGIIDHILNVLKDAADLQVHPILKQLWDELDGETFINGTVV